MPIELMNKWVDLPDKVVEVIESGEVTEMDIAAGKAWRAQKIADFEAMFGISSEEFLRRWRDDTIADTYETNVWSMLVDDEDW